MNAKNLDELIDSMYIIRNNICAYTGSCRNHQCDCKYGVTKDSVGGGESGSGCPEIQDVIDLLITLKNQPLPFSAQKLFASAIAVKEDPRVLWTVYFAKAGSILYAPTTRKGGKHA